MNHVPSLHILTVLLSCWRLILFFMCAYLTLCSSSVLTLRMSLLMFYMLLIVKNALILVLFLVHHTKTKSHPNYSVKKSSLAVSHSQCQVQVGLGLGLGLAPVMT